MLDKMTVPVFSGDFMKSVSEPLAHCGDRCGIEIVKTVNGDTLAVLTDYSPYSNDKPRTLGVRFDNLNVSAVENLWYDAHDININFFERNGRIDGFSAVIRPREVLVFKLRTNATDDV